MRFADTTLPGVAILDGEAFYDERGFFVPLWVASELSARGLSAEVAQCSHAFNARRGTIRGMHFQTAPFEEVKIVRVLRGAVFDVAVDLRPDSTTFKRWVGIEISAGDHRMLYIPRGLAHGYQTLTDETEVLYFVSAPYSPTHQRGVRWNDAAFGIEWPLGEPTLINERDRTYPDFDRS